MAHLHSVWTPLPPEHLGMEQGLEDSTPHSPTPVTCVLVMEMPAAHPGTSGTINVLIQAWTAARGNGAQRQ